MRPFVLLAALLLAFGPAAGDACEPTTSRPELDTGETRDLDDDGRGERFYVENDLCQPRGCLLSCSSIRSPTASTGSSAATPAATTRAAAGSRRTPSPRELRDVREAATDDARRGARRPGSAISARKVLDSQPLPPFQEDNSVPGTWKAGLEGVVAGKTALSMVDGQQGRLTYRGYEIGDLARHSNFEEVCHLLWHGALPTKASLQDTRDKLAKERALPNEVVNLLKVLAGRSPPMDALRTSISALSPFDPDVDRNDPASNMRKAHRITAKTATIIAAYHRLREGHDPIAPRHDLSHAANFLYMLNGKEPDAEMSRDFDVCLVLHADHGYNASTFSARVVASSLSDMHSAVTAAVGSLKGPLHGGANEAVMHMLEDIGSAEKAEQYIAEKLSNKEKIPGFGHRIYKVLDPRAPTLKEMSERLGRRGGNLRWYEMSTKIQAKVKAMKGLDANVDFYSASTYHSMNIPTDLFTPIFALSRVSGWTAHVIEQLADNRIFRPDAEYSGADRNEYVPIDKRA